MAAGLVALLCLGGVGVFISLYDDATKINRADPDVVVSSFLRAYLGNRNDEEAALYTCKSDGEFTAIGALRSEIISRERDFDVKVGVNWGSLIISGSGDERRNVATELTIAGSSGGQALSERTESWTFSTINEDGWRVCSAVRVS